MNIYYARTSKLVSDFLYLERSLVHNIAQSAWLSVLSLIVAKGVLIACFVIPFNIVSKYSYTGIDLPSSTATLMIGLQFLPQLILSIFTTIGFSLSSMKLIIYHPETLLLSSGTHFENCKFTN